MIVFCALLSAIAFFAYPVAHAILPPTPCTGLVGCADGQAIPASNVIVTNLPQFADFLILVGSALSILFIVYAGFRMVIANGDDSQISEQKTAITHVMLGLTVMILSQLVVSFVGTQEYGQSGDPKDFFLNATSAGISILLTIFNAAMAVAIVVGGAYMVHAQGKSDQFMKGKTIITYAIVGALVANLANALVQALANLLNVQ